MVRTGAVMEVTATAGEEGEGPMATQRETEAMMEVIRIIVLTLSIIMSPGDGEHSPFSSEGGKGSGVNVTNIVMDKFR